MGYYEWRKAINNRELRECYNDDAFYWNIVVDI